jgi:hypothetical protein
MHVVNRNKLCKDDFASDPHPRDKPDPDPHQFADDKPKFMEYEPICGLFQGFEPLIRSLDLNMDQDLIAHRTGRYGRIRIRINVTSRIRIRVRIKMSGSETLHPYVARSGCGSQINEAIITTLDQDQDTGNVKNTEGSP